MHRMGVVVALATSLCVVLLVFAGEIVTCSPIEWNLHRRSQIEDGLCAQLIHPSGYPCSEHSVQTKDGFVLALQRVSAHTGGDTKFNPGPPILLQHGLFQGGDTWFANSIEQSLGFILADHGFDVWVGNVRGTHWSRGHISFSEKDKEFWDWSWQELALSDLAEMITYVYSITNSKIFYVGHSQMLLAMGVHQLDFRSDIGVQLLNSVCDGSIDCSNLLSSITGKNCCFNESRVDIYLEYEPHPTSSKNLNHLFQMIREGTFAKYDYGWWGNLIQYGSRQPPAFDVRQIPKSLPLWMGYGGNDGLADVTDVKQTLEELQSKPELLYLDYYGHMDFILSVTAREEVYNNMIEFFRSWRKSSNS